MNIAKCKSNYICIIIVKKKQNISNDQEMEKKLCQSGIVCHRNFKLKQTEPLHKKTNKMLWLKQRCRSHWVLPWSRYKKVLFDFLVTNFVLLL